jgi:hypothetical protein
MSLPSAANTPQEGSGLCEAYTGMVVLFGLNDLVVLKNTEVGSVQALGLFVLGW